MTKYFTILLFASLLFAASTNDIDAQIEKIKNADASQRVKLMNAFKLKVSQMNQKEQQNAIESIQKSMRVDVTHNKQTLQTQANNKIMRYQNMNQQHLQGQVSRKETINTVGNNFHPKTPH